MKTQADLDEKYEMQYNVRLIRPDSEIKIFPKWKSRSASFRAKHAGQSDVRYGSGLRETLDVFCASGEYKDAPVLVFFHGGYWQRGDKSTYSFIAEALTACGVSVILVNYDVCPSVSMYDIVTQVHRAVAWIGLNCAELQINGNNMHVGGHSAGAHLAALLAQTDWTTIDSRLPAMLLRSSVLISGLYDLSDLRYTTLNDALCLGADDAGRLSPLRTASAAQGRALVVCGSQESPALISQSSRYAAALTAARLQAEFYIARDCDHFTVLDELSQRGLLLARVLKHLAA